jgi:hypothetical protein
VWLPVIRNCRLYYLGLPLLVLFWPAPVATQETCGYFTCKPTHLYRGDTLRVTLSAPQNGCDMVILPGFSEPKIVSFTPLPGDKVAPMIAPEKFAKAKYIDLVTTEAKGSSFSLYAKPGEPAALKSPELIFSKSNDYAVLVGKNLRYADDSAVFSTCNVEYSDQVRPKSASRRKSTAHAVLPHP